MTFYRKFVTIVTLLVTFALLSVGAVAAETDLKVLFWGDRDSHHQPLRRFQELSPAMLDRGIQMVFSDDWNDLTLDVLNRYDALVVYGNATHLPAENEAAIIEYVESGAGVVPIHSASAMFTNSNAWLSLVGAQFQRHGGGVMTDEVVAPDHPVIQGFEPFENWEETYIHSRHNEENRTVLTRSTHSDNQGEPFTWVRTQGEGRVFYTAWGHDERTFTNPGFHDLIERGIRYAAGQDVQQAIAERQISNPFEFEARSIPTYGGQGPSDEMQLPLSPEESMQRTVVPGGFSLELYAADPFIGKPIDINWDEKGRVWILETSDYPNQVTRGALGEGNDRLVILEDTDGDGIPDTRIVFAENLNIPTSFAFANGGVIVQMAPYTVFLKDTTGDDKADVMEIILDGWNQGDTHAGASNLTYGLDNHIWGVVGYSGRSGLNQGVWRIPLDVASASDIEHIAVTTNNTWGFGMSEEGLVLVSTANNNPSGYVAIPRRYFDGISGFNQPVTPNISGGPIMLPNTNRYRQVDQIHRYTAAAGHSLYTARAFPQEYWNNIAFVNEPTGGLTANFILERDGADVTSFNPSNLVTSDDEWMSPIVAKVGPDGAVWIIDFYNFIIQHNPTPRGYQNGPGNAYQTELRDNDYGRIYRVVWDDAPEYEAIDLSHADLATLIQTLTHDNMLWRLHAQRMLVEEGQWSTIPMLVELIEDLSVDELGLNVGAIHALWTLHGIGALDGSLDSAVEAVYSALEHPSAGVRRNALQVLPSTADARDAILASEVLNDADGFVRLEALLALSQMPESDAAGEAIFESLQNAPEMDQWVRRAAVIAGLQHAAGFLEAGKQAGIAGTDADSLVSYGPNLVRNSAFEELDANGRPVGWSTTTYGGQVQHGVEVDGGRRVGHAISISSSSGTDASWDQSVTGLEPGAEYHFSAWVKTENVSGALGATLHMHEMQDSGGTNGGRTQAFRGENDWTFRETVFTASQSNMTVLALFGGWGQSTGKAIYDEIALRKIETDTGSVVINIYNDVASRQ